MQRLLTLILAALLACAALSAQAQERNVQGLDLKGLYPGEKRLLSVLGDYDKKRADSIRQNLPNLTNQADRLKYLHRQYGDLTDEQAAMFKMRKDGILKDVPKNRRLLNNLQKSKDVLKSMFRYHVRNYKAKTVPGKLSVEERKRAHIPTFPDLTKEKGKSDVSAQEKAAKKEFDEGMERLKKMGPLTDENTFKRALKDAKKQEKRDYGALKDPKGEDAPKVPAGDGTTLLGGPSLVPGGKPQRTGKPPVPERVRRDIAELQKSIGNERKEIDRLTKEKIGIIDSKSAIPDLDALEKGSANYKKAKKDHDAAAEEIRKLNDKIEKHRKALKAAQDKLNRNYAALLPVKPEDPDDLESGVKPQGGGGRPAPTPPATAPGGSAPGNTDGPRPAPTPERSVSLDDKELEFLNRIRAVWSKAYANMYPALAGMKKREDRMAYLEKQKPWLRKVDDNLKRVLKGGYSDLGWQSKTSRVMAIIDEMIAYEKSKLGEDDEGTKTAEDAKEIQGGGRRALEAGESSKLWTDRNEAHSGLGELPPLQLPGSLPR